MPATNNDGAQWLELHFQAMEPFLCVDRDGFVRTHALCKQDITFAEILAEVEFFHCAAQDSIHLQICHHTTRRRSEFATSARIRLLPSQFVHFIDALLSFEAPAGLSLCNVSSEVSIRVCVCSHHLTLYSAGEIFPLTILLTRCFMRLLGNRQAIVYNLHICVAAS